MQRRALQLIVDARYGLNEELLLRGDVFSRRVLAGPPAPGSWWQSGA
jgi:hypothetical protein